MPPWVSDVISVSPYTCWEETPKAWPMVPTRNRSSPLRGYLRQSVRLRVYVGQTLGDHPSISRSVGTATRITLLMLGSVNAVDLPPPAKHPHAYQAKDPSAGFCVIYKWAMIGILFE